jgi:hypothetical protein
MAPVSGYTPQPGYRELTTVSICRQLLECASGLALAIHDCASL